MDSVQCIKWYNGSQPGWHRWSSPPIPPASIFQGRWSSGLRSKSSTSRLDLRCDAPFENRSTHHSDLLGRPQSPHSKQIAKAPYPAVPVGSNFDCRCANQCAPMSRPGTWRKLCSNPREQAVHRSHPRTSLPANLHCESLPSATLRWVRPKTHCPAFRHKFYTEPPCLRRCDKTDLVANC